MKKDVASIAGAVSLERRRTVMANTAAITTGISTAYGTSGTTGAGSTCADWYDGLGRYENLSAVGWVHHVWPASKVQAPGWSWKTCRPALSGR